MGNSPAIHIRDLHKTYVVSEREGGVRAALASLVHRKKEEVKAVDGISFDLAPGEIVGFLGPNGAGKTTTLKMLSGLLHPTSGELSVLGYVPWKRDRDFLRQITLVMGQRNQLVWDIPAVDSFELNRAVYRVPAADFRATLDELTALLELGPLLKKPVRNLSLGERMKCEVAAALLHRPQVVFLDEPTIGLDVTMQRRIRAFIAEYNRRHGATVLLTSHYMADVVALSRRVIVIHHGKLLFDGDLSALVERFTAHKTIVVSLGECGADLSPYGTVVSCTDGEHHTPRPQGRNGARHGPVARRFPCPRPHRRGPADRGGDRPGVPAGGLVNGTVRWLADIYAQQFKVTMASFIQYRAALVIWLIGHVLEPLVYLVVWTTVTRSTGGEVGGFTAADFAAYFIVLMVVNHMTYTWIMYEYDYRVRQGTLSPELLRPVHPIHSDIADNITSKLITLPGMLAIAGLMSLVFRPAFRAVPWAMAAFVPVVLLAFIVRFVTEWTLALAAFWTTRVSALNQAYFMAMLFFSGQIAPLELLPQPVRIVAFVLPFRWTIGFPAELLLGRLTPAQALTGVGMQLAWLAAGVLVMKRVWRAGLKVYSAVGA